MPSTRAFASRVWAASSAWGASPGSAASLTRRAATGHTLRSLAPKWRNWQTRTFEGRVGQPVGVRVPPSAPSKPALPSPDKGRFPLESSAPRAWRRFLLGSLCRYQLGRFVGSADKSRPILDSVPRVPRVWSRHRSCFRSSDPISGGYGDDQAQSSRGHGRGQQRPPPGHRARPSFARARSDPRSGARRRPPPSAGAGAPASRAAASGREDAGWGGEERRPARRQARPLDLRLLERSHGRPVGGGDRRPASEAELARFRPRAAPFPAMRGQP
jgi:hypothetical protein